MTVRAILGVLGLCVASLIQAQDMRIHGSNTVGAALAPALVKAWLSNSGYRIFSEVETAPLERRIIARKGARSLTIELHSHGSSTGFRDVLAGGADVAMSSRPIRETEAARFAETLGGFDPIADEYVVALDGIAVIVNPANPTRQLSKVQLESIFSGAVRDWGELGWSGGAINLYARDDRSGTFDTFANLVLGDASLAGTARRYESNQLLSDDVARDRGGIGFVSLPNIRSSKAVSIFEDRTQPLLPTPFAVATEDYALARRLFFYVPASGRNAVTEAFLEFAQSQRGQAVAEARGYVAQYLYRAKPFLPDDAPTDYAALVEGAERLSVNIRFRPGATRLDSKAERDLERIRRFVQTEGERYAVMLMGFADAQETSPAFATQLSLVRAEYIGSRLQRLGVQPTRIRGYGPALPVASNQSEGGRQKNRRVEIWVYDTERFRPPMGMIGS
ncbi:MAG: phosphate ABC transporter substrate-binding/OmpA family protein [Pseudomonadota bacterium]